MLRYFLSFILLVSCIGIVYSQPNPDSIRTPLNINFTGCLCDTGTALNGLRSELSAILPATQYRRMTPSCKVVFYEPDNSLHPIYAVNPDIAVKPASVEKLFTTSAALWALGSDYSFETRLDLISAGRVEESSVIGNIYLRPSGDPTLSLADFDSIAKHLTAVGITQIEGDIVADLSDDDVLTPEAKRYFAEHTDALKVQTIMDSSEVSDSSAITEQSGKNDESRDEDSEDEEDTVPGFLSSSPNFFIDRNALVVRVSAGSKKGAPAHITVTPPLASVKIINRATTGIASSDTYKRVKVGSGRKAKYKSVRVKSTAPYTLHLSSSEGKDGVQYITLSGIIPARQARNYSIAIENVPLVMASLLKWRLEANGIRITGTARTGAPPKGFGEYKTLIEKQTGLLDLLQVTNKKSDNYLAESMFRKLSSVADVKTDNPLERSRTLIRSWMNVIDVDCSNGFCADGSGLSHSNQTSATTVINLLHGIRSRPQMFRDFVQTMSVAGVDGTTRGRMINTPAQFNAHSKTGTLNGVTALAGYVSTQDGQLASYFITMQNFGGGARGYKSIQDQIVQKLASFKYSDYLAKYAAASTDQMTPVTMPETTKQK